MTQHPDPSRESDITTVFTLALTSAELLLRNGASSADVTRSMLGIARAGGYSDVTANVTLGQITLSHLPRDGGHPVTRVQNVGPTELDLRTMTAVEQLVESIVIGDCTIDEGLERIAVLEDDDRSPRHLRILGALAMAAGFAWMLGGGVGAVAIAAVCAAVTEVVNDISARIDLPTYYARAISSGLAVAVAGIVLAVTPLHQPGVIITASLVTQLAGGASVSAIQDLLTGWLLTACGRLIEATILTVGLVVGAIGAVTVVHRLGIGLDLAHLDGADVGLVHAALAAGLVALGFAAYCQAQRATLLVLPLLGMCGTACHMLLMRLDVSTVAASSLAAMVLGILTIVLARPLGWPTSGALDIAVVPLLPGMAFYEGLTGLATHSGSATSHLFEAIAVALAIGTGAVFGQYLAGQLLWSVRRGQMHLRERRSGEVLEREQFAARGLATPDFSRSFNRS